MTYYHVVARVGAETISRVLFEDLTSKELKKQFLKPYWKGQKFFSGNELILPNDLRLLRIIQTHRPSAEERAEINAKASEAINRFNRANPSVVIIGAGRGYDPEDIADVGVDLTANLTKGPPGRRAGPFGVPKAVVAWIGGILATLITAGILRWLEWP